MGTALSLLVMVLPWLAWVAPTSATCVVLGAVAIGCAFHGWGRLVARMVGATPDAILATWWGIATVTLVAGLMLPLRGYDPRLLVIAGVVLHTIDTAYRWRERAPALTWREVCTSAIAVAPIVMFGVLAVLASAGQVGARMFDDDTHVVAQVQRLITTGTLGDALAFPRLTELGGHVTLGGLATVFGDAALARILDRGVAFTLVLLLPLSRATRRGPETILWTVVLVVLCAGWRMTRMEMLPFWLTAGFVAAIHGTASMLPLVGHRRRTIPLGIVVGAACSIRHELAPIALVVAAAAAWPLRRDRAAIAMLVGAVIVTVVGYVVSRQIAYAHVGGDAGRVIANRGFSWPLRIAIGAGIALALLPLGRLLARTIDDRGIGWLAAGLMVAFACIPARITGRPPISATLIMPMVLGVVIAAATVFSRERVLRTFGCVVSVVACCLIYEYSAPGTHRSWVWRMWYQMRDVEYARHLAPLPAGYDDLLAHVPRHERIALSVMQPELVDYGAHDIVDLSSPRTAATPFARLVSASGARWLLVEGPSDDETAGTVVVSAPGLRLLRVP
jgi:hypothetical protein